MDDIWQTMESRTKTHVPKKERRKGAVTAPGQLGNPAGFFVGWILFLDPHENLLQLMRCTKQIDIRFFDKHINLNYNYNKVVIVNFK